MRRKYHSHALRSMYRRFGIMEGNLDAGFTCLICNRALKTTNHFYFSHREYYERVSRTIDNRSNNLIQIYEIP